jgi:phosphatidylglycerophosphate synthase
MKLHRSNTKPDWELIDETKRNPWQKAAARTVGILTPGNIATAIGIALVIYGLLAILDREYWWGVLLIIVGRLCDLLDGWLAEATRTKSPLGEMLDASIDKIGTIMTVVVFYIAGLATWWLLTLILLPHVIIILISVNARRKNVKLHPSRTGKVSMAAVWVALFGLILIRTFDWPAWSLGSITVYVVAMASIALGAFAAIGYLFHRD